jgi:hypothetical protein
MSRRNENFLEKFFFSEKRGRKGAMEKADTDAADTDASEAPVAMIVNSSELRAAGFDLREVLPLQLEAAARGARRSGPQADSRHGYQEVWTLRG